MEPLGAADEGPVPVEATTPEQALSRRVDELDCEFRGELCLPRTTGEEEMPFVIIRKSHWWQDSPLKFVPTFSLLLRIQKPDDASQLESFTLDVISYNGKILSHLPSETLNPTQDLKSQSDLLKFLAMGHIRLCQGVDTTASPKDAAVWKNLRVCEEERSCGLSVARSLSCQLGVLQNSTAATNFIRCSECHKAQETAELLEEISQQLEDEKEDRVVWQKRLESLKDTISVVNSVAADDEDCEMKPMCNVTVETKEGESVDFLKLKEDFWKEREEEEGLNRRRGKRKRQISRSGTEVKHLLTGNTPSSKACPICQVSFSDVSEFMAHLSRCNVFESSGDEATAESSEGGDKKEDDPRIKKKKWRKGRYAMVPLGTIFECKICCHTCKHYDKFEAHMKAHEKRLQLDASVNCPECGELVNKRQLNPHFGQIHPGQGGCCVECLNVMPCTEIRNHLLKEHPIKQQHQNQQQQQQSSDCQLCPMCGKRCVFTSDMELHLATHHLPPLEPPPIEEVMCHQCGKVFSHRYKLKQHLTNIHNKTFKHSCPFCNKAFNLRHQLTKHLVTHSDLKPFKCRYCDYKNARKYRVVKHIQKAHHGAGTEDDMELLAGTAKTAEFVHNMFGI